MNLPRHRPTQPYQRLGRWNPRTGTWDPVTPRSIGPGPLYVLSHGWTPGLREAMQREGFLAVWDERAVGPEGRRYDTFFVEAAGALHERVPVATVLAYTWADESATRDELRDAGLSQRRTVSSGRRLAVALEQAMTDPDRTPVHLLGHSHGSKVCVVAAAYLDVPPQQVTLFDSPDRAAFTLGGVQNDLQAFLRLLTLHPEKPDILIDNYVSQVGIRYSGFPGTSDVHDIVLDPGAYPLIEGLHPHSYGWAWYLNTVRDPSSRVGFGWSSPLPDHADPPVGPQRQRPDGGDAFALEAMAEPRTGLPKLPTWRQPHQLKRDGTVLATPDRTLESRIVWRGHGAAVARSPFRWLRGSPGDKVELRAGKTVLWSSAYGWPGSENGYAVIPLVALPVGPHRVEIELIASGDAAVLFGPDSERISLSLPVGAEKRAWIRRGAASVAVAGAAFLLGPRLGPRREA